MSNLANVPKQSYFKTTLASPIDASQTTNITLSAVPDYTPGGETVYISITDPDNPETLSCTGWNTTTKILSGVTRGVANYSGGGSSASAHAAGVEVVLSNNWQVYDDIKTAINSKVEDTGDTMSGALGFSGTNHEGIKPIRLTTAQRTALTPATTALVYDTDDSQYYAWQGGAWVVISSGSVQPNASETVAGKIELATTAEQGAGTSTGGTGARLVPANSNLVKTSSGAADENKIGVLDANGKYADGFLDRTATPTANKTPKADGSGDLDKGWIPAYVQKSNFDASRTTGEAIDGSTTPQVVCIKVADGLIYKADANDTTLVKAYGFITTNALITTTPEVIVSGIVGGFAGLTVGAMYYVSDTAGSISDTPSTTTVIPIGRAISATEIEIVFGTKRRKVSLTGQSSITTDQTEVVTLGFRAERIMLSGHVQSSSGANDSNSRDGFVVYHGTSFAFGLNFPNDATGTPYKSALQSGTNGIANGNYIQVSPTTVSDTAVTFTYDVTSVGDGSGGVTASSLVVEFEGN